MRIFRAIAPAVMAGAVALTLTLLIILTLSPIGT